jgi:hypothetical protein
MLLSKKRKEEKDELQLEEEERRSTLDWGTLYLKESRS